MKKPSLIFSILAVNTLNILVTPPVLAQSTTQVENQNEITAAKKQKSSVWSKFTKELKKFQNFRFC